MKTLNQSESCIPNNILKYIPIANAQAEQKMRDLKVRKKKQLEAALNALDEMNTSRVGSANRFQRLRFLAAQFTKIFSSETACASGCSHCCHIGVAVSKDEATIISKAIGVPLTKTENTYRIDDVDAQISKTGIPCTFLKNGECSIYEHRPLACITHVNMDSSSLLCKVEPGVSYPVPYLNVMPIQMHHINAARKSHFADIRDWFPLGK